MPVRFGIVGCGKVAERLALPQLTDCPNARVTALVDIKRQAARRLAEQFGLDRRLVWTDWRRMLREAEVDAVAVCVPNVLHHDVALGCCRAKKHVMVEKPIATTLEEADTMIQAASSNQRFLMVEQTQRFDPVHEVAQQALRSGALGAITQLRGRIGHAGPEYWSGQDPSWFTNKEISGGGALVDVGVHILDLLRWLSGKEVKRICCQAKTLQKRVPVEDNASALLEFADGTLGSFEVSWTTRPYEVTTQFYGDRGKLRTAIGSAHPVVIEYCAREGDPNNPLGEPEYPPVPSASRVGGAYPYFTQCIKTGTTPFVSGEEGRATLEVILGAYESIRSGGWVELPLAGKRGSRRSEGAIHHH